MEGIIESTYVGDYLDSFKTEEEAACQISLDVRDIFRNGGFEGRNWTSPILKEFRKLRSKSAEILDRSKTVQARLQLAQEHYDWAGENVNKWRNVLWSDESKVNLVGSDGKRWVRRPLYTAFRPQYTVKTVKHGGGNIRAPPTTSKINLTVLYDSYWI